MDPITGKSRELDVHGIGGASIYDDERGNAFVFQHLLIECVNSPQPVLFISSEQMMNDRKVELIKEISDPPLVFDDGYFHRLPSYLKLEEFHHYTTAPLATQFCSFVKKKGSDEWMALHEETQYGSFVALGQAVEFHLTENGQLARRSAGNHSKPYPPHIEFFYPIYVVEGELWSIDQSEETPEPKNVDRINYKHSTFVDGVFQEYIVSVVTEEKFLQFLEQLESEVTKIANHINEKIDDFEASQRQISVMDEEKVARLPIAVSPHLARIVAATIVMREREAKQDLEDTTNNE